MLLWTMFIRLAEFVPLPLFVDGLLFILIDCMIVLSRILSALMAELKNYFPTELLLFNL